jgi:L-alanine-DL-glutamate epimerase-like enolase superfamily enzyme
VVRAVQLLMQPLAQGLIDKAASATFSAWQWMWKRTAVHGRSGVHAYAVSALDTALWDLKAKLSGLPLYRLLGAARESVPSYYSGGFLSASDGEVGAEAERVRVHGCAAFKMRIGMPNPKHDLERARLVKEAFGGELMVDAAGSFDRTGTLRIARELAPLGPLWIEDPVPTDRIRHIEGLRGVSAIPFAGGELLYTDAEVADFAKRDTYDHVLFDLQRIGGVTGWIKSAAVADHYGLRVSAHVFPEISTHMLCGLENGYFHESLDWSHELFANPPALKNGRAVPSNAPGLGLTFDSGFASRHLVEEAVFGKPQAIPARLDQ